MHALLNLLIVVLIFYITDNAHKLLSETLKRLVLGTLCLGKNLSLHLFKYFLCHLNHHAFKILEFLVTLLGY